MHLAEAVYPMVVYLDLNNICLDLVRALQLGICILHWHLSCINEKTRCNSLSFLCKRGNTAFLLVDCQSNIEQSKLPPYQIYCTALVEVSTF